MHSPAIIQRGPTASGQKGGVSTPSYSVPVVNVARKRPQSVGVDGGLWVHERWGTVSRTQAHPLAAWARIVLPQPAPAGQGWPLLGAVLADYLVVLVSIGVVSFLQMAIRHHPSAIPVTLDFHPGFVLLYGALLTLLGHSEGLYGPDLGDQPRERRLAVVRAVSWATLLTAGLIRLLESSLLCLCSLTGVAVLSFLGMLAWRDWQRQRTADRTRAGLAPRNVLIVGATRTGRELAAYLEQNAHLGRLVRGFLDDDRTFDPEVLGGVDDLGRIARAEFADEIILAAPTDAGLARRVIQEARRIHLDVKLVPQLFGFAPRQRLGSRCGRLPVITLYEEPIPAAGLLCKRALDVAGSLLGLVISAPLLALIALLIRVESPGPVLYRAPRAGRKGHCFLCYKFRTMTANADHLKEQLRGQNHRQGPFFKLPGDPRITPLGRFLRRYSLDELPQLWNVLKGEMSLVGPRPHPLDDLARYELDDLQRLDVTPGITGLWQVTARQDPSFRRNLELDREYVERWSLWLDLRILIKTFQAVLQGSGA